MIPFALIPGLHDIKPLPEFFYINWLLWLVLAGVLALIVFAIKKILKKPLAVNEQKPILLTPDEEALKALLRLRNDFSKLDAKTVGEKLSEILRRYLMSSLSFPAIDYTREEIAQTLPLAIREKLPVLAKFQSDKIVSNALAVIYASERWTFSEEFLDRAIVVSQFDELAKAVETLVKSQKKILDAEDERQKGLADYKAISSKQGQNAF